MRKIVIVAESGSDLTTKDGIEIVPMHVTFGRETLDDGTFSVEKIVEYYKTNKMLPKTSGCTPDDFIKVFERIRNEDPSSIILYLAYSSITTVSYASCKIACENMKDVYMIDTKQVSIGQGMIVYYVANYLKNHPTISIEELIEVANDYISKVNMAFIPENLEFLKAGGRVSNVAYLGARILGMRPVIEIIDGKLVATKKYRGKLTSVLKTFIKEYDFRKDVIWFVYTIHTPKEMLDLLETTAKEEGYQKIVFRKAGGVITTHAGPGAIGMAGFRK